MFSLPIKELRDREYLTQQITTSNKHYYKPRRMLSKANTPSHTCTHKTTGGGVPEEQHTGKSWTLFHWVTAWHFGLVNLDKKGKLLGPRFQVSKFFMNRIALNIPEMLKCSVRGEGLLAEEKLIRHCSHG